MKRNPAPPRSPAPISQGQLEIVKKKISSPLGPPPAGLSNFKSPKKYDGPYDDYSPSKTGIDIDINDSYDANDYDDDNKFRNTGTNRPRDRYEVDMYNRASGDNLKRGDRPPRKDADSNRPMPKSNQRNNNLSTPQRNKYYTSDNDADDIDCETFSDTEVSSPSKHTKKNVTNKNKNINNRDRNNRQQNSMAPRRGYNSHSDHESDNDNGPDEESEYANATVNSAPRKKETLQKSNAKHTLNNSNIPSLTLFNFRPILHSTYRDLRSFVLSAPPAGQLVRCYIERNRSGSNMLAPFYSLCADLEDGTGRELLVCRKVIRSRSPHYIFSLKSEDLFRKREQRSRLYLGKLRATSSSEYVLYDSGILDSPNSPYGTPSAENSDDGHDDDDNDDDRGGGGGVKGDPDSSLYRQQMAVIHFNTKIRPVSPDVRGMEVCIPVPGSNSSSTTTTSDLRDSNNSNLSSGAPSKASNIQQPFQKIREAGKQNEMMSNKYFVLHERQSKYDPLSSCLVDFKARATIASIKNFQLIESTAERPSGSSSGGPIINNRNNGNRPNLSSVSVNSNQTTLAATAAGSRNSGNSNSIPEESESDVILLQLGKATEQCFNLDFQAPLTMLQSFAIAVTRFDAKLTW